jgi:predicted HicB family RNase H-like nuclease
VTFNLRFGEDRDGLKAKLIAAAKDNGRSLNQEILARLRASVEPYRR